MKIMYKVAAICTIVMFSYNSHAQILTSNRQNHFDKYAAKLATPESELE